MNLARLVSLVAVAGLALTLIAATAASASPPEFNPGTEDSFLADSGTGATEFSSVDPVICTSDKVAGKITGPKTVGDLVLTASGCSSEEKGGCLLNSPGEASGTIVLNPQDGELGSVKKAEAASGVGLFLLPASGTTFIELEAPCLLVSPAGLDGSIAGEVTPVESSSKGGKLVFLGRAGTPKIKEINVSGSVKKPKLEALGLLEASESNVELLLSTDAVEVT